MQESYLSLAKQFFCETDQDIDPDAAVFLRFFEDSAFWLWFGNELQFLDQRKSVDPWAQPIINRYLHGLICADRHLGEGGVVIKAMTAVLSHTPELFACVISLPPHSLVKCLEEDAGPHSQFASARFLQHLWLTFGTDYCNVLETLCGPLSEEMTPLVISASLSGIGLQETLQVHADGVLRQALALRLLTAVQSAALPGAGAYPADEVFSETVHQNLARKGYLTWPEWQLLPLLKGGIEHAKAHGIDLVEVSKAYPVGGKDASIWSAAFLVGHAASADALHRYFCDVLLPSADPVEIMPKVWSMGSAMGKWAIGYIEQHRDVFLATPAPGQWALSSLINHGVSKQTVMSHPGFSNQAKGQILSDDLGI